jgi:hypothetical protein
MRNLIFLCLLLSTQSYALQPTANTNDEPGGTVVALESASHNKQDPTTIVKGFYNHQNVEILWSDDPEKPSPRFSKGLAQRYASGLRKHGQFVITFDPIVNGQDALITNLVVYPAIIDGNRAQVYARFRNFDTDNAMVYSFVSESRAWKLDEIAAIGGEIRWLLTDVLENP